MKKRLLSSRKKKKENKQKEKSMTWKTDQQWEKNESKIIFKKSIQSIMLESKESEKESEKTELSMAKIIRVKSLQILQKLKVNREVL